LGSFFLEPVRKVTKTPGKNRKSRGAKPTGPKRCLFKADWVLSAASPPTAEGAVLVEGPTIREVGRAPKLVASGADEVFDLAGHLLLPGLVNAHTHLELSFLRGRLRPGEPFHRWVEALVGELLEAEEAIFAEAVRAGVAEALANGITAVGDISRSGLSYPLIAEAGLKATVFVEVLGFHPLLEKDALKGASATLDKLSGSLSADRLLGLTPHAPYSTSANLYREAAAFARHQGLALSLHVSETPEEELFVREARGPLREMLERFGLWHDSFSVPGCSPVAYLERLGALEGATAIHCNTVDDEDIERLRSAGARVVLCPGSNDWFGRPARHPLLRLLKAGVGCSLGTDSLASNHRLDMLTEMGLCAAAHPELSPEAVLHLATVGAAEAIGLSGRLGSIEKGKAADLVALRLPPGGLEDPLSWVVTEATGEDVALVVVDGAVVHTAKES
jgi:cytosine/adenosine deaminase-related metal-dependent hydrolase